MKKIMLGFFLAVAVAGLGFADDYDEVRELLRLPSDDPTGIRYLSRINLGIPGGENWIANSQRDTYIYTVDSDKNVKLITKLSISDLSEIRFWDSNLGGYVDLEFDIMQNVPGTQLGSRAAKFGDFNGDGIDGILSLQPSFDTNGVRATIREYNIQKGEFIYSFLYTFAITSTQGPVPINFVNYRGTDGIVVQTINLREQITWYFFARNEETQEYERMTAIGEDEIDFSTGTIIVKESGQNTDGTPIEERESTVTGTAEVAAIVAEGRQPEETALPAAEDGTKSSTFVFIIILIGGAVVLAAVVILLVARKKRK